MSAEKKANCGTCRHFYNKGRTWCQRFPPVPVDNRHSRFPVVIWDMTCGEWQAREAGGEK